MARLDRRHGVACRYFGKQNDFFWKRKKKRNFRIKSTFHNLIDKLIDTLISEINEGRQTKLTEDFQKYLIELISITGIQSKKEQDSGLKRIFEKQEKSLKSLLLSINEIKKKIKLGETTDSSSIRNSADEFKKLLKEEIASKSSMKKNKEAA